ncbi:hypothetical protein ACSBR2_040907 [Camellia fascicularis]
MVKKVQKKATRPHPITTHRCWPSPINIGNGGSSPHRDQAPPPSPVARSDKRSDSCSSPKRVLVGPTILSRGVQRVLYLHWAARFFSKGVSQRYENNEHLFLSTLSLGFFFSTMLVSIVHKVTGEKRPWLADNLNQGRLYNFYWLLAILSVLNLFLFLVGAKWYVYKEKRLVEEGLELEKVEPSCHA